MNLGILFSSCTFCAIKLYMKLFLKQFIIDCQLEDDIIKKVKFS